MANMIPAVVSTAKKVYYVLRNRSFGYVSLPQTIRGSMWEPNRISRNSMSFKTGLASATRFASIDDLLTQYGAHGVNNGTYSSNLEIIRVEEIAGVASRRIALCSEKATGYVIVDGGSVYLQNPDLGFAYGWTANVSSAKAFGSEKEAISALIRRCARLEIEGGSYTVARIIDVPAVPTTTETVLS
jgi:hypothetical protein